MLSRIIILICICNIAHGNSEIAEENINSSNPYISGYDGLVVGSNGFSNDYLELYDDDWKTTGVRILPVSGVYKTSSYMVSVHIFEDFVEKIGDSISGYLDEYVESDTKIFQTAQGFQAIFYKYIDEIGITTKVVKIDASTSSLPKIPEKWFHVELKVKSLSVTPSDEEVLSLANKIVFKHGTPSPRKNLPGFAETASSGSGGNDSSTGNVEDTSGNSTNTEDVKTNSAITEPNNSNNALSNNLKPLAGSSGWYELDWFGYFFDSQNVVASMGGWVFHEDLGWLFLEFSSGDRVWCWASNKGWLWTSSSAYPYLYSDESNNWIYVFGESTTGVNVFNFNPNTWGAWQDLTLMKMTDPGPGSTLNNSAKIQQIDGVLNSTQSSEAKISSIAEIIRANL